jgi:hypothetical protein
MKTNEYDPAEVAEIGKAAALVLGGKIDVPDLDSSGGEPMFWQYRTTE